jgi:hypothetical protein
MLIINDINAQTKIIEESSNSQAAVESNESDDIIIESYVSPSSEGPDYGVNKIKTRKTKGK